MEGVNMDTEDPIRYPSIETAIRANQIAGEDGAVRDMNGLGSALAALRNAAAYEDADLINQAAILIQRIALNHPFIDGNKRAAFILGSTFLMINGYQLSYRDEQEEMALAYTIEAMVADKSFDNLVEWIEDHITLFDGEDE
jgi:death-on-curing protein